MSNLKGNLKLEEKKEAEVKPIKLTDFIKQAEKKVEQPPDLINHATLWNPKKNVAALRKLDKTIFQILELHKKFEI